MLAIPGCLGARSRAERLELERSPLRDVRPGQVARYRAERTGEPGVAPVVEEWTFSVRAVEGGFAKIDVAVIGPPRTPASPSPREPGYVVDLPTKDEGWNGVEMLKLFRHPELTTRGMRAVLDRGATSLDTAHESAPLVVAGRTHEAHTLTIHLSDESIERATYRVVIVDDLPLLGIVEADLDEVWLETTPDGDVRETRRHDHLVWLP